MNVDYTATACVRETKVTPPPIDRSSSALQLNILALSACLEKHTPIKQLLIRLAECPPAVTPCHAIIYRTDQVNVATATNGEAKRTTCDKPLAMNISYAIVEP